MQDYPAALLPILHFSVTPGTNLNFLTNVKPGDVIRASVTYVIGVFFLALKELTSGFTFSKSMGESGISRSVRGLARGYTEWRGPELWKVRYWVWAYSNSGTDTASTGTHTGSIGSFAPLRETRCRRCGERVGES